MRTQPDRTDHGRHLRRTVVTTALIGCLALIGLLVSWVVADPDPARPAPGPGARAATAVGAGVPVALPDLLALVHDRERRVRTQPRDARSWAVLGVAYTERGRRTARSAYYPKAERALRTSLRIRPRGNAEALAGLAELALARRDFRGALDWAGKVPSGRGAFTATAYGVRVTAHERLGETGEADTALAALLRLGPRTAPSLARAAWLHQGRGRTEDAAAQAQEAAALAEGPAERAAWLGQNGELAFARGEAGQALRYHEAALRADPAQCRATAGRGRALAALGRTREALRAYEAASAACPLPEYALELGELYESLGRFEEAAARYETVRERVRRRTADGVDGALVLGGLEADHGDPEAAVRVLRAEWRRAPGLDTADALGWALHRAGADDEAWEWARRTAGTNEALFAYHRAEILLALGSPAPAARAAREALRLNPGFSPLRVKAARGLAAG